MRRQIIPGVTLNILQTTQFKTTRLNVSFISEVKVQKMTQRALLASVLETNSADYPTSTDVSLHLAELYGAGFGISVDRQGQQSQLNATMILVNDRFLPGTTHLLTAGWKFLEQILFRPNLKVNAFDAATFQREKANMAAYLKSIADDKQSLAALNLQNLYFTQAAQQTPNFGKLADLAAINAESLASYYHEMLAQDRIEITVVGQVDPEEIVTILKKWPLTARTVALPDLFYRQPLKQLSEKTDVQEVRQTKFDLAYQVASYYYDEHYFALLVANAIFGGSAMSLLFLNVREKASLAYYASSQLDIFRGLLIVQTGIDQSKLPQVRQLIDAQLADLRAGKFSDAVLAENQQTLISDYITQQDSPHFLGQHLYLTQFVPAAAMDAETFTQKILQVTREQVQACAQTWQLQATYTLKGPETAHEKD